MGINNVYHIFKQIEMESGKTAKEALLKQYKDDQEFREALVFLLNQYIVTGISTKKINKEISYKMALEELTTLKEVMDYLKRNNSGRDIDVLAIQQFANSFEDEAIGNFVRKFVTKDLKLGISEKTVNKVYGKGTIPSFAVMLAESFEKKHAKVTGKFFVTLKLDGNRCIAINEADGVKFFSRKGQPITGLVELEEQFKALPTGVYDGEALLINKDNLDSAKLFRATQKVIKKDGDKKDIDFHIFDYITVSEFQNGKSTRTYEQRRNTLDVITAPLTSVLTKNINVLPVLYAGEDKSVIPVLMKGVEEKGHEGLMINTANGLYQTKRVVDLLKVKTMKTADLLVMSIEKAIDGQFEGLLGRVNVEYRGNLVGVGSGFTLEQRKEFINNPDAICGKIIEVQFFEETKDEKTNQPSLRFPVFKGIRDDKGVEDINYGE